ncbi:hypothetical protein OSTOST_24075 [Ostertagia ostertagi]
MATSGHIKGQLTKATNALKARISLVQEILVNNCADEVKAEQGPLSPAEVKQLLVTSATALVHLMETLQGKWTSAENYAKGVTTEAERFALLQEFADHWDSIRADEALINAKALVRSIEEQLRDLTKTPVTPLKVVDVSDSSASSSELLVHVPKLELPDFYGEPSAFPEFWELYLAAIHNNPSIPAAVKFLHLKSKLKGKAKTYRLHRTVP